MLPSNGSASGADPMSQEPCGAPSRYSPSKDSFHSFEETPGGSLQLYGGSQSYAASLEEEGDFAEMKQYSPSCVTSDEPANFAQSSVSRPVNASSFNGLQWTRRRVLRRAPAGPYITITDSEGMRVYLKVHSTSQSKQRAKVSVIAHYVVYKVVHMYYRVCVYRNSVNICMNLLFVS